MIGSLEISPELRRMELLREFKLRVLQKEGENVSPFADRIATAHGDLSRVDLNELHGEVRENIAQQIASVRSHQRSQVVLLSGDVGTGKSHLLRYFAQPDVAEEHGYIFVGGSNDWKVEEFQPCLLDWMITALTAPSPTEEHLLLERVRAIGFRAVGQLLENRTALKRCTVRRRGILRRILGHQRASYETIVDLTKSRNPEIFKLLDFTRFSDEVCTRFLAEPGNPVHRYALKVLLTYLFPNDADTGMGSRDRVLNWFRRRPDDGYWAKRLGVADDLERRYAVADAIKLLIHLFSQDLTRRLSSVGEDERRPLVFLFVFDQAEGRDELFDRDEDWNHFFAHLSELYNSLPNVLVLFTMTLPLRNILQPKMERQFKDRIRKDERFVLRQPTPEQILALYRARLSTWLQEDTIVQGMYTGLPENEQYLPFTAERVNEIVGTQSVRGALEALDPAFKKALEELVIEPRRDFEYILNEERKSIEKQSEYDYTAGHLDTVSGLLNSLKNELATAYEGAQLVAITEEQHDKLRVLRLEFQHFHDTTVWVSIYLARFGVQFNAQLPKCENLLYRRQIARYSIWMVRAKSFSPALNKPDQMMPRVASAEIEAQFRAIIHLLDKRAEYEKNGTWPQARTIVLEEIGQTYLGEMLSHARDRLNAIRTGQVPDEPMDS